MYRPDSENGFSDNEREAYLATCTHIVAERRAHGFTLDERDSVSDYLAAAMPLPLLSDDEFVELLVARFRMVEQLPARAYRSVANESRRAADDATESRIDNGQGEN